MLSLEEAIEHCYKKARELPANECECANEHFQLAAWLEELKARRAGEYITQGDIIRRMNNEQIARLLQDVHFEGATSDKEQIIHAGHEQHFKHWLDWVNYRMPFVKGEHE